MTCDPRTRLPLDDLRLRDIAARIVADPPPRTFVRDEEHVAKFLSISEHHYCDHQRCICWLEKRA